MLNIRQPAYSSLFPKKNKWEKPSDQELDVLSLHVDINNPILIQKRVIDHLQNIIGYYRYKGGNNLFVKIVSHQDHGVQNIADDIAGWLYTAGVSVSVVRSGYPKKIVDSDYWIYLYDYLEHEFNVRNCDQLYLIGKEVGKMHRLMQGHPYKEKVCLDGNKKNKYLFQQLKKIKLDEYNSNFSTDSIELIKCSSYDDYHTLTEHAQMVHGDLNFGNIVFNTANNKPVIIDFEDSSTAWLNPLYDIAFIIQRFILLSDSKNRIEMASSFIGGYKTENYIKYNYGMLMIMLKMISIRSLLVLSTLDDSEHKSYKSEIDKFVNLHKKTLKDSLIISEIEDIF